MGALSMCVSVQRMDMYSWSLGRLKRVLIPLDWSYRLELLIMRVLGIDLESSEEQPVLFTAEPRLQLACQLEIGKHGEIQPWARLRGCFQKQLLRNQDPPSKQVAQISNNNNKGPWKITGPACFHFFMSVSTGAAAARLFCPPLPSESSFRDSRTSRSSTSGGVY